MKYAIIENDNLSLRRIKGLCEKIRSEWTLVFTAQGVSESRWQLERNPDIDLLLCDIELSDGNIFDLFSHVEVRCPVIFITAYEEYSIEAFNTFCIDYVLKPIEASCLEKSFLKLDRIERITRYCFTECV